MTTPNTTYDDQSFTGKCPTCGQKFLLADNDRLRALLEEAIDLLAYWGDDNEHANEDVARLRGELTGDFRVRTWAK
jgi:hypothetical protein